MKGKESAKRSEKKESEKGGVRERRKTESAKGKTQTTREDKKKARTETKSGTTAAAALLIRHGLRPTSTVLGEGSYAQVRKATRITDGSVVAVKVIDRVKASHRFLTTFLPRELSLAAALKHPHLVAYYEHFENQRYSCMVMELVPKGDLEQHLSLYGPFRDTSSGKDAFRLIMRGVTAALVFLHSKRVCHRDLKCENVLLGPAFHPKVADLGFARKMEPEESSWTFCGSRAYAAPEILGKTAYKGPPVDCWSLGIVLYICLTARLPFDDRNIPRMLAAQRQGTLDLNPRLFKPRVAALLRALLRPEPDQRLPASAALAHPALATP